MRRPSNNRVNPTVGPVTALAKGARAAPVPPAGYPERYAAPRDSRSVAKTIGDRRL